nr:hypothetical protein [Tanacetum cinerariifolium]
MLPIELTNDEIRNTKAYKEYYAFVTGEATPKPKASARRKRSGSDTFITPPTVAVTPKLTAAAKGKQPAKAIKAKSPSVPSEILYTKLNTRITRRVMRCTIPDLQRSSYITSCQRIRPPQGETRSGSDTFITPPTVAVTPKLTAAAKGKQPAKAIKAKSPSVPSEVAKTEAQQLKIVLKRSRQQTHIS